MSSKVVIVLGPMGCGKTTIGELLAIKTGYHFADADDYHPQDNKEKMGQGIPLTDTDREPWLSTLRELIVEHQGKGTGLVLACSALKKKYRVVLGIDQISVYSVYLKGSYSLLEQRLSARSHGYMSKGLLQSQLETLEEPTTGLTLDIAKTPEQIYEIIKDELIPSIDQK